MEKMHAPDPSTNNNNNNNHNHKTSPCTLHPVHHKTLVHPARTVSIVIIHYNSSFTH